MNRVSLYLARCLAVAVCSPSAICQAPQANDRSLQDYRRFDAETKRSLLRVLERKIQLDPNPAIQRIVSMQRGHGDLPKATMAPHHLARKWARGAAPKRKLIVAGDERHSAVRRAFPARPNLPDLTKAVYYDWGRGEIVRRGRPLSDDEIMRNFHRGYPPGSDAALARLLAKFDNDKKQRMVASYLSRLYADLDAQVFEGVTLYEAWYSGKIIDVPDVDAIAFERKILKTRRFKSPIPNGRRRTKLYGKIRDAAFLHRKYRTLREAAAIAFLRAEPKIDPTYAALVPRFHYLFADTKDDIHAVAKLLEGISDRDAFIAAVDARLIGQTGGFHKRKTRKLNLDHMFQWLNYWTRLAIYNETQKRSKQTETKDR